MTTKTNTTFTAHIPSKTYRFRDGRVTKTQAHSYTFSQDERGRWVEASGEYWREADVIDACKSATNWKAIKADHFPMVGFHS